MNENSDQTSRCWCEVADTAGCPHIVEIKRFHDGTVQRVTFRHPRSRKRPVLPEEGELDLPDLLPSVTPKLLGNWGVNNERNVDMVLFLGQVGSVIRKDLLRLMAAHRGCSPIARSLT